MTKRKRIIIGMSAVILLFILSINFGLISEFSFSETITSDGEISNVTYNPIIGHGQWATKALYKFSVNGRIYTDSIYLSEDDITPMRGDRIKVEYIVSKPEINKIKN